MFLGRVIASGIGLLVSSVFIVASAVMNYSYLSTQAETLWQDRLWLSSRHCEDATAQASLDYCKGYFQRRLELKNSVEFGRLEQLRATYTAEILKLKTAGANRDADPQGSFIVRLFRGAVALS